MSTLAWTLREHYDLKELVLEAQRPQCWAMAMLLFHGRITEVFI